MLIITNVIVAKRPSGKYTKTLIALFTNLSKDGTHCNTQNSGESTKIITENILGVATIHPKYLWFSLIGKDCIKVS